MTTQKRFAVFDSDSHVVEPRDVWEKYLEPEYRAGKTRSVAGRWQDQLYLKVNGEIFRDTMHPTSPGMPSGGPG